MKRVEAAIESGRCVLILGERALGESSVLAELRRRSAIPAVTLGNQAVDPARELSAEALEPATSVPGGIVVLVEPEASDGRGLEVLSTLLSSARNKPRLHVVARAFNPFMLPMKMRLMKLDQHKLRARDFMAGLPVPAAPVTASEAPAAKVAKAPKEQASVRAQFVGREEELVELGEKLGSGGPLAIVGPSGVGRRWLVEKALEDAAGLRRWPDFSVDRGSDFDTFAALIASATGNAALGSALRSREPVRPTELVRLIVDALQDETHAGAVMVISNLRYLQHPDGSFARKDRLGLTMRALLTSTYAPRLIFITDRKPAFYRDGEAAHLSTLTLGGLKGRELYSIFESHGAGEVDRSRMGEVHNQTAGHPMAVRAFAVAWRETENKAALLDNKRFLKLGTVDSLEPLDRHYQKRMERLEDPLREALILLAHAATPLNGQELTRLGVSRAQRIELSARGLLDTLFIGGDRNFHVHPLVRSCVRFRKEFSVLEILYGNLRERISAASGVDALALLQHANRYAVQARSFNARERLDWPDEDGTLESIRGLLRGKSPHLPLARQRIMETLKRAPSNTELRLLQVELLVAEQAEEQEIVDRLREADEAVPTPELFHSEASWRLDRGRKGDSRKAIEALARGIAAFPSEGSLYRRLGALQAEQGLLAEAELSFRKATEIEPGAPESYSRLGEILIACGPERWEDAEQAIRYAMTLEPERGPHGRRLAMLLRRRAMLVVEGAEALREEARELLEQALRDTRNGQPYLELALLLLEADGDMERAEWCARKAGKLFGPRNTAASIALARILARRNQPVEAEQLLQRALKQKGQQHLAHAALGELYFARGRVFAADQEFALALQFCVENSPEAVLYAREKALLEVLITSGQAVEIERAAEATRAGEVSEAPSQGQVKMTHDRGTVVRRKRHAEDVHEDESGEVIDAAPAEVEEPEAEAEELQPAAPELESTEGAVAEESQPEAGESTEEALGEE